MVEGKVSRRQRAKVKKLANEWPWLKVWSKSRIYQLFVVFPVSEVGTICFQALNSAQKLWVSYYDASLMAMLRCFASITLVDDVTTSGTRTRKACLLKPWANRCLTFRLSCFLRFEVYETLLANEFRGLWRRGLTTLHRRRNAPRG